MEVRRDDGLYLFINICDRTAVLSLIYLLFNAGCMPETLTEHRLGFFYRFERDIEELLRVFHSGIHTTINRYRGQSVVLCFPTMQRGSPVESVFHTTEAQRKALRKLRIRTVEDLIYHFPSRYGDVAEMRTIGSLQKGDSVVVFGRISKLKASKGFRTKRTMGTAELVDDSGKIQIVWFNQPYIAKMIPEGALVRVEGKVSERRKTGALYFSNPKIEKVESVPQGVGDSLFGAGGEQHHLHPVYPESRGITTNWLFHSIQKV